MEMVQTTGISRDNADLQESSRALHLHVLAALVSGLKKVNQEEGLQSYLAIRMLKILK